MGSSIPRLEPTRFLHAVTRPLSWWPRCGRCRSRQRPGCSSLPRPHCARTHRFVGKPVSRQAPQAPSCHPSLVIAMKYVGLLDLPLDVFIILIDMSLHPTCRLTVAHLTPVSSSVCAWAVIRPLRFEGLSKPWPFPHHRQFARKQPIFAYSSLVHPIRVRQSAIWLQVQ